MKTNYYIIIIYEMEWNEEYIYAFRKPVAPFFSGYYNLIVIFTFGQPVVTFSVFITIRLQ